MALRDLVADHRQRGQRGAEAARTRETGWRAFDPRLRAPVFILGAPRSGTTFLGTCVGAVPDISYHFEPRVTKAAARHLHQGLWSPERAGRVFRAHYGLLLAAAGEGGRRFAEKNPENCFVAPFLADTFPGSSFVYIVRDGRDAAVSHREQPWLRVASGGSGHRGRSGVAWGPQARFWVEQSRRDEFMSVTDLERSAWCWRRFCEAAEEGLAQVAASRVLTIRYEAMVQRPSVTARELSTFLELPEASRRALQEAMGRAKTASVGRWRSHLSEDEIAVVERQCSPMLQGLGYETTTRGVQA